MYKAKNTKKDIELHGQLFELMALYGSKENYAQELIDLQKLYDINFGLKPNEMLEVLREAWKCGEKTVSFIFVDTYLQTIQKYIHKMQGSVTLF
jgi:hypothetical protein